MLNFINKEGRTYLIKDPDNFGNGHKLGWYREGLHGGFKAHAVAPLYSQDAEFETEQDAQNWLKNKANSQGYR